jgi:hypothetical protein
MLQAYILLMLYSRCNDLYAIINCHRVKCGIFFESYSLLDCWLINHNDRDNRNLSLMETSPLPVKGCKI